MKHKPTCIWAMHSPGRYPNAFLQTTENGKGHLRVIESKYGHFGIDFTRAELRMLIRRINQFLDDTK